MTCSNNSSSIFAALTLTTLEHRHKRGPPRSCHGGDLRRWHDCGRSASSERRTVRHSSLSCGLRTATWPYSTSARSAHRIIVAANDEPSHLRPTSHMPLPTLAGTSRSPRRSPGFPVVPGMFHFSDVSVRVSQAHHHASRKVTERTTSCDAAMYFPEHELAAFYDPTCALSDPNHPATERSLPR